jgi:cytochrome P450
MPPYNWATGHLLVIKEFVDKLPTDAVFNYVAFNISRTFTKHDMFYLDFWPFMTPILVIKNPYVAGQIMGRVDARKPVTVRDAFVQMTGGDSLLTMAEQPWKQWRSIFAPGFSPAHMLDQVPVIVDQGKTFCGKLREAARNGTLFQLEEATLRLTIDVISLVAL